jgi:hypothetical protein
MISEIKSFVDGKGRMITAKVPCSVESGEDIVMGNTEYMGTIGIRTPNGQMPINFEFPEGLTLEECFDKFDEYAQKTITKMQEEAQERSRIIPATSMPKNGGLIIP